MSFKFEADNSQFKEIAARVKEKIGPVGQAKMLDVMLSTAHKEIVERTPIRTGDTRRHWLPIGDGEPASNGRTLVNTSVIMVYLELGTHSHKTGKWLITPREIVKNYIPDMQKMCIGVMQDAVTGFTA